MATQRDVSFADVSRQLDNTTQGADELRADQLEQLVFVRQVKESALKREKERLTNKLGAEHPSVAEISGRLEINSFLQRDLKLEAERARTEIPRVTEKSWAVHGFVRDKDLNGAPNLTVALYDASGKWQEQFGFACTQRAGDFRLEVQELAKAPGPLFLHVLTAQAARLYMDKVALTPRGGATDYREIILPAGAQACSPPVVSPNDPVATPGVWVVRGRVSDAAGKGLAGVTVSLFDKDLLFDDRLGTTTTDNRGDFNLTYLVQDFNDVIESKPDIYLKVLDQKGKTIHTSKDAIRFESGRVEIINVAVSGKK